MSGPLDAKRASGARRSFALSEFFPYRLVALGHRISQDLSAVYADEDLTIPEWRTLAVIGQASAIAARDVAQLTPMDKMAVSRAVASLERKGLVERERDAEDQRVRALRLSKSGRAVFDRVASLALAFEERLLAGLSEGELQALKSALAALERPRTENDR